MSVMSVIGPALEALGAAPLATRSTRDWLGLPPHLWQVHRHNCNCNVGETLALVRWLGSK